MSNNLTEPRDPLAIAEPNAPKEDHDSSAIGASAARLPRAIQLLIRLRAFEALRYREYRLIWYAQVFASQATWMDQVTRGWLLYELTNSTLQLGLVRGVQAIPLLLLSPLA
ncbi:MAG TPA: MFS transporter, partial [Candidatus Binatia bacterium]|nr:MFS transporter [Candidatus Binatia bacterium]